LGNHFRPDPTQRAFSGQKKGRRLQANFEKDIEERASPQEEKCRTELAILILASCQKSEKKKGGTKKHREIGLKVASSKERFLEEKKES